MATLQKIRNKSWLLLSVIGLGLLAFIFMDLGSFLGGDSNESKVIGNVLGEDVLKEEFQNDLNLYTSQNPGVPSGQAIDLVWDQHISRLVMQNEFDKLGIDVCDDEFFKKIGDGGYENKDPIFILGLPRSGSTLIEQIISSHSMVDGTLELPNILSMAQSLRGEDIFGSLGNLIFKAKRSGRFW